MTECVCGVIICTERNRTGETERRLEALGMTDRTRISVLGRKGRGILIVKLRGSRFALGAAITHNIEVERAE